MEFATGPILSGIVHERSDGHALCQIHDPSSSLLLFPHFITGPPLVVERKFQNGFWLGSRIGKCRLGNESTGPAIPAIGKGGYTIALCVGRGVVEWFWTVVAGVQRGVLFVNDLFVWIHVGLGLWFGPQWYGGVRCR